jgi:hypothetical protein
VLEFKSPVANKYCVVLLPEILISYELVTDICNFLGSKRDKGLLGELYYYLDGF